MKRCLIMLVLSCFFCGLAVSQTQDYNLRGVDSRVDYNELWRKTVPIGIPWDDRNLGLTKEDLDKWPAGDIEDTQNIPVWFRLRLRAQYPEIRHSGKGQYPRSAAEVFELFWGGEFIAEKDKRGGNPLVINGESNITDTRNSAESAIAINPVNSDLVIAGVNGPSGQEMYFSSDAGLTWTRSTSDLGNSCCDPTMGWSVDGSIAYMSQLGTCGFLCNIEFFTSTDNGQTWGNKVTIRDGSNNDKQYIHVDHYPTSPHRGNIYAHWHKNNTIEFARSTDQGVTWDPAISFAGTQGIGGDVTTDTSGRIYHIWPRTGVGLINMNISNDGGQTFGAISQVADTNAAFDYPIPIFDNRNAFIYVSTDVDRSDGSFKDRVYACWNDTNGPESGTPANNHSKITVVWSSDGGTTWNEVTPHSTADIDDVDRWNPWMEVDEFGTVHVAYASTINDPNRLMMDVYHTFSTDGAVTWSAPVRVTSTSSPYIGGNFQWGDYNGMSIVDGKVRPIWTDNRSGTRVYTLDGEFTLGGNDFEITSPNATTRACAGGDAPGVQIDITPQTGFTAPVTLTFDPALPAGITGNIVGSPVSPPGMATVNLSAGAGAPEGLTNVRVVGTGGGRTHDLNLNFNVLTLTLPQTSQFWQNPPAFNQAYDLNDDGGFNIIDMVSYMNLCLLPR